MNGRTIIMLILAAAIITTAFMLMKGRSTTVAAQEGPKILVATMDIPAGSFVRADKQLGWVDWPKESIAPSFITPDAHKIEEFSGGVARRTILTGEPITSESVVRANDGGFMSAVLTPGMRAVSIAVSPTSGNAGFIFPGDKVDLILTHKIPGGANEALASETFIHDVRVLAIDQMLDNPEKKAIVAKTITLEVLPKQAEMINVATNLGSISVSLRSLSSNAKDQAVEATNPLSPDEGYSTSSDVSKLMGDKTEVRAKVSVYHGGTSEQLDFHQEQK